MTDFHQTGVITTFHNLVNRPTDVLEKELKTFSRKHKMGLILPSLFSELEGPALGRIIDELANIEWLEEIIIGLDNADREQFLYARSFFSRLPQRHRILWQDGPRLKQLDAELAREGLAPGEPGKGRNVWYCTGYVLASDRTHCVALHDCDILTWQRSLLARLFWPVANPSLDYEFSKGFYARVANNKLNGRVGRLLVGPLLRSLRRVYGHSDFLEY